MKSIRLARWGFQNLPLATRQTPPCSCWTFDYNIQLRSVASASAAAGDGTVKRKRGRPRKDSTAPPEDAAAAAAATATSLEPQPEEPSDVISPSRPLETKLPSSKSAISYPQQRINVPLESLPSPPISSYTTSAKLSALRARLALPNRIPIQTVARTLIDRTADPDARFNNASLAILGNDLLGYYMAEHLLCHFPRLPMAVLYAANYAYIGPSSLTTIAEEWGVEVAAEPGGEVDAGLLQFKRTRPGALLPDLDSIGGSRSNKASTWRRGVSSEVADDDEFGGPKAPPSALLPHSNDITGVGVDKKPDAPSATLVEASSTFVRALFGAVYLHSGTVSTHRFFKAHILSRHLDLSSLFTFTQPTRDLSRLCVREGFESPVARLLSETGRASRHPVFVVGVFSGRDKLGEAAGASLNEARFKAAIAALKGWYLYSPAGEVMVPSEVEGESGRDKVFKPAVIDDGEIVV